MLSDNIWGGLCPLIHASFARNCIVKNWRVKNCIVKKQILPTAICSTNKQPWFKLNLHWWTNTGGGILQQEYGWHVPSIYLLLQFHIRIFEYRRKNKLFWNISEAMSNQKVHKIFGFFIIYSCIRLSVTNFHCNTTFGVRQWIMAHNWTLLHESDIYLYQPVILKVSKRESSEMLNS